MAKFVVHSSLYRALEQTPPGGEIRGSVHSHGKLSGACEVIAGGRRPIKCNVRLAINKGGRRRASGRNIEVIFRKR